MIVKMSDTKMERKLKLLQMMLLITITSVESAKILSFPASHFKNSALRNVEKISAILAENGHEVHMLVNDQYTMPGFLKEAGAKSITFPRATGDQYLPVDFKVTLREALEEITSKMKSSFSLMFDNCENAMSSKDLLDRLKQEKYDLLLLESIDPCKRPLASHLHGIPTIEFLTVDFVARTQNKEYPLPVSYYPMPFTLHTPVMSFPERVKNLIAASFILGITKYIDWRADGIAAKHGIHIKPMNSLGLVFGGFPVEYPAPTMPDLVYMNGLLVSKPKPLEADLESFVQSSRNHGVIMMSFGSMVKQYDEYYGELFAEAFSRLPQKVIWKYDGPIPKKLGNNTKLMKWLPQTSLLAHPKTKLFITHCGINSAYESIHYGVPIIALPIFGDQPYNAARFTRHHQVGVLLDLHTVTAEQLVNSIQEVLSNPQYEQNAEQLAAYLNDQPISSKDLMLYWVDYVLRHKSVEHLKPYGRHLPWYQFYMLDVISFLLLILTTLILVSICGCKFLLKKCRGKSAIKAKKE